MRRDDSPRRLLSDTELRLLLALRELGPSTAPDLAERLQDGTTTSTIQGLLYRMADKGVVVTSKERTSRVWRVESEKAFDEVIGAEVRYAVRIRYLGAAVILQELMKEVNKLEAAPKGDLGRDVDGMEEPRRRVPDPRKIAGFCRRWKIAELAEIDLPDGAYGAPGTVYFVASYVAEPGRGLLELVRANRELAEIMGKSAHLVSRAAVEADPNWLRRPQVLASLRPLFPAQVRRGKRATPP